MTQAQITPTVGRVVHFFDTKRRPGFHQTDGAGPYAALIAKVCGPDHVNLTVSDANGTPHGRVGVPLSHEGGQPIGADYWCEWMPYQKGQAAKTEAVEKELATRSQPERTLLGLPVVAPEPDALEREIQAKANKAPRVTPADIEAEIASEHYFTAADGIRFHFLASDVTSDHHSEVVKRICESLPTRSYSGACIDVDANSSMPAALGLLTFCVLVLRNGFTVTGESACASPENFNAEIGRKIARENAVAKIWPLLGFRLRDQLHERAQFEAAPMAGEQLTVRGATFDDLVRHGLAECYAEHRDSNIINGMPWSFTYKGLPVSHENDNCYIIAGQRFERGQELFVDSAGQLQVGWPAREGSPTA